MSISTDVGLESRVLDEGYGHGGHGANLKAALADVMPALAFWQPAQDAITSQKSRCIMRMSRAQSGPITRVRFN